MNISNIANTVAMCAKKGTVATIASSGVMASRVLIPALPPALPILVGGTAIYTAAKVIDWLLD